MDDELTWGHVRQTVLLQGKVPGDWCGRFWGRLFLTNRSFRFLARLKAFNGGLLKILLVLLSSERIRKFLEIIFLTTTLLGRKVVTKGTLSLAMLLAVTLQNFSPWFGYGVAFVYSFKASLSRGSSNLLLNKNEISFGKGEIKSENNDDDDDVDDVLMSRSEELHRPR